MGVDNFRITFDNPAGVFYAGHKVSGCVKFDIAEAKKSDGVFIRFIGKAEVHWSERKTTGSGKNRRTETVHYKSRETYIDSKVCLYVPPKRVFQPDNYSIPFSFLLTTNLPSSFVGSSGKINYFVRANVHRPFKFAKKITLPFSVVSFKDLNDYPDLNKPMTIEDYKFYASGCCCYQSKPLRTQLTINRQAFVSGEHILISGTIDNASSVKIHHCDIYFKKHVIYKAKSKRHTEIKKLSEIRQPEIIGKNSSYIWTDIRVFVPCIPPSGLEGCRIIDVYYTLEVLLVPCSRSYPPFRVRFDVMIGSVPYQQYYNTLPPAYRQSDGNAITESVGEAGPLPSKSSMGEPSVPSKIQMATSATSVQDITPCLDEGPSTSNASAPCPDDEAPSTSSQAVPPSAPASAPLQYVLPTSYGDYGSGDPGALPSYDDLFKGEEEEDEEDDDGAARNYIPKYPSYKTY